MMGPGGRCIAFNGEIYNYRELRAELVASGAVLETRTDTEVILHLYDRFGDACVDRLRGMFAFAIVDGERVFLARDRYGIKPLYYARVPEQGLFVFASEVQTLLECRALPASLDIQAFADSVVMRYPFADRTFFAGIHALLPGHTMTCVIGTSVEVGHPQRYFTANFEPRLAAGIEAAEDSLDELLREAVACHLHADTDVGLTLSGGLDSAILALLASESRDTPMHSFTVADHRKHPDVVFASHVAAMIGSRHHTHIVTFNEYLDAIPALIAAEEQPSSLTSLPFFVLCRSIQNHVKVCLHGEGADELFGGYSDYLNRGPRVSSITNNLQRLRRLGMMPSDQAVDAIRRLSAAQDFSDYLHVLFEQNLTDQLQRLHLDPVDRLSMASSVEMRVPYVDDRVVDWVTALPEALRVRADIGVRKYLLRRYALRKLGEGLIDVVLREKLGVPSAAILLLQRFDDLCEAALPTNYLESHELGVCFERKRQLLLFELFLDIFFVHRGDYARVGSVLDFIEQRASNREAVARVRAEPTSEEAR